MPNVNPAGLNTQGAFFDNGQVPFGLQGVDIQKALAQYGLGGAPLVNPAGLNGGGTQPQQPGSNASGFQGFPNFNVPFPYLNLPAQLQASMQTPRNQTYGRFGNMPAPAQGMPGSLPQLPPQAQATLPQLPPSPSGLPQLPTQQPGTMPASNLPPGPGGGMPGFAPSASTSYNQMKADMLNQLTAGQRQRAQAYANSGPSLAQFQQTFGSLPTDAAKFQYWNSLPNNGSGAIDQYLSTVPGFRSWVNEMFNNYNGGSLAGLR